MKKKKYEDAYVRLGTAVYILATSYANMKSRVTRAIKEIRLIEPEQLPKRELVQFHYNALRPYMTGDLYDAFFRNRLTKLKEIACNIYALREEVAKDYRDQE